MPTGYTCDIESGKITEFRDFALMCARNFGALIMMRGEAFDAPIPERFEPSDYHVKALAEARKRYAELKAMDMASIQAAASACYEEQRASDEKYRSKADETRARYEAMLEKVMAWEPPSPDHVNMKSFMIQQLEESIRFDCSTRWLDEKKKEQLSPLEWYEKEIENVAKEIDRHVVEHEKEVRRTEHRNQWVKLLRDSLALEPDLGLTTQVRE